MPAESLTFREIDPDDTDILDRWMSTVNMVFTAPFLHTPQPGSDPGGRWAAVRTDRPARPRTLMA
jgi:hypothetical protein